MFQARIMYYGASRSKLSPKLFVQVPGLLETSPGVRTCMIEYDSLTLPLTDLLALLDEAEVRHVISACRHIEYTTDPGM